MRNVKSIVALLAFATCACSEAPPSSAAAPSSPAQLNKFSKTLARFFSYDAKPPLDVEEIYSDLQWVAEGVVVGARAGRKELVAVGCGRGEGEPCEGDDDVTLYASYVNLVVRPTKVFKGSVESGGEAVEVELPWPNNVPVDAFVETAPRGARVLIAGDPVVDGHERAAALRPLGLTFDVADRLLSVPPYGLIVERADGSTALPLEGNRSLPAVTKSVYDDKLSFAGASKAFELAAR